MNMTKLGTRTKFVALPVEVQTQASTATASPPRRYDDLPQQSTARLRASDQAQRPYENPPTSSSATNLNGAVGE